MSRRIFLLPFFFMLMALPLLVQASDRVHGVRVFLSNGDPDQAILTAKVLLKRSDIRSDERFELFQLLAYAEETRAQAGHYENIQSAIQALQQLQQAFPNQVKHAPLLWRMTWLYWKHGDNGLALKQARDLRANYAQQPEAMEAAMLMARIYIQQHKYREARNNLMRYGLGAGSGSREEALTKAWLAVVDAAEKRYKVAAKQLDAVQRQFPDIIHKDVYVFSVYIQVLHTLGRDQEALKQANDFLGRYVGADEVPAIRLLRADIWVSLRSVPIERIEREYDALAQKHAAYSIGKQAFMRKLMLLYEKSVTYYDLKPVIIALKRLAENNQLSNVENEAMFDLGMLWERLSHSDPKHAPKAAIFAALDDFSRVARSDVVAFRGQAKSQGSAVFDHLLDQLVAQQAWDKVVALWQRYPHLRGQKKIVKARAFEVAHAFRILMDYAQAEELLNRLYDEAKETVWGQKVMLELAHLWFERGDVDAVPKILAWLNEHEYTLYRPDMLLLVAKIQLRAGQAKVASQTFHRVSVDDIASEDRHAYWQLQAEINEALKDWHGAAGAWKHYQASQGGDIAKGLLKQADALFYGKKYAQARVLYANVKQEQHDAAWQYHISMCRLHLGEKKDALKLLDALKQDSNAGVYASLAAAELASQKALDILRQQL